MHVPWGGHSETERQLLNKVRVAKCLCIFGLGELFRDNFFQSGWHNVLHADIFSDNDPVKWNTFIGGLRVVPPSELSNIDGLLVITYVKDDSSIRKQLAQMGISNLINIYDLFNARDRD